MPEDNDNSEITDIFKLFEEEIEEENEEKNFNEKLIKYVKYLNIFNLDLNIYFETKLSIFDQENSIFEDHKEIDIFHGRIIKYKKGQLTNVISNSEIVKSNMTNFFREYINHLKKNPFQNYIFTKQNLPSEFPFDDIVKKLNIKITNEKFKEELLQASLDLTLQKEYVSNFRDLFDLDKPRLEDFNFEEHLNYSQTNDSFKEGEIGSILLYYDSKEHTFSIQTIIQTNLEDLKQTITSRLIPIVEDYLSKNPLSFKYEHEKVSMILPNEINLEQSKFYEEISKELDPPTIDSDYQIEQVIGTHYIFLGGKLHLFNEFQKSEDYNYSLNSNIIQKCLPKNIKLQEKEEESINDWFKKFSKLENSLKEYEIQTTTNEIEDYDDVPF